MLLVLLLLRGCGLPGGGYSRRGSNGMTGHLHCLGFAQRLLAVPIPVPVAISVSAQMEGIEAALYEQDAEERLGQRAEHFPFVGLAQLLD